MRIVSWNVAGLRACIRKGFYDVVAELDADVYCLQEVKATSEQLSIVDDLPSYSVIWNPADKAGYSGTMMLLRRNPLDFVTNFGVYVNPTEGRVITAEFNQFYLVTSYVPNSQESLRRLPYRLQWEADFRDFMTRLKGQKAVVICGDLNVAHRPIDLARPVGNEFSPGFSKEERAEFDKLLDVGFVDTYRHFNPSKRGAYTFWSYMGGARARNVGWRLDYFLVSREIFGRVRRSEILSTVEGSDHCPVLLDIDID